MSRCSSNIHAHPAKNDALQIPFWCFLSRFFNPLCGAPFGSGPQLFPRLTSSFVLCSRVRPAVSPRGMKRKAQGTCHSHQRACWAPPSGTLYVWTGCEGMLLLSLLSCLSVNTSILRPNTRNIVCMWKQQHHSEPLWDGCMLSHAAADGRHKTQICLFDM